MSAIRLPLSAELYSRKQGDIQTSDFPPPICHPERSEGSRCKALVSLSLVNTGRREDIRLSDGRHQTYIIPERKGVQAPEAPGFKPPPGLRPWVPPVLPAARAGSEEVMYAACGSAP